VTNGLGLWVKLMRLGRLTGCHQMGERSFFARGYQFPICARCTGILFGNIAAIIGAFLFVPHAFILLTFCAAMFVDWLLQRINLLQGTNIRRLLTGVLGGYAVLTLIFKILVKIIGG